MPPDLMMFASSFLGFDSGLLAWLLLAFAAAMIVGNVAALIKPPAREPGSTETPVRPPLGRTLVFVAIGALAAVWALASLVAK